MADQSSRAVETELLQQIRQQKSQLLEEIEVLKADIREIQAELDELDDNSGGEEEVVDDVSRKQKSAKKLFNSKPKKGIEACMEAKLCGSDPKSIAKFLFEDDSLKKGAIGEYMGEGDAHNIEVLKEFANLHDFTNMNFDQSLRKYLWSFRLPGEAQKIDRMMETFAKRFVHFNPNVFSHEDTCYVLAFSTIMLNTALHNPNVRNKQTLESFITMNRGIDQGNDLPSEMLEDVFKSIEANPFKLPEDEEGLAIAFFNPERAGWLTKEGGKSKSWKRRWFSLVNNCVNYFEKPDDAAKGDWLGTIPLENLYVREVADSKRPNCFEIYAEEGQTVKGAKKTSKGQMVQGNHSSYKFQAKDRTEMEEWMKCIRASMQKDPVYELYRMRRQKLL